MDTVLPVRATARPGRVLPAWPSVLAVVAHPDDESFGLGAVIDVLVQDGAELGVASVTLLDYPDGRLAEAVAGQLRGETRQGFVGQPDAVIDPCVRVSRSRQRRAALLRCSLS